MKKYKRGYTQGVFDMFHIGHLKIFEQAKDICDFLVVGVNSDQLTFARKNKKPVISLKERMEIVEAIRYVDLAFEVNDPDHYVHVMRNKCDALLVGDDWKGSEKFNALEQRLSAHGVDVVYLPYTKNISSTILRDKKDDSVDG
ncbi:MAG: adenylyltransferase/cytidyltransferase family protein [Oscillospiraceae bacterium]|nr:adenylyltransferase/cytidyltransferase family protein [Oscillospiraceae bacterium]